MRAPICTACGVQMKCDTVGVDVELMAGKNGYQIWSGDKYTCPECEVSVVCGFGAKPVAEHFEGKRYAEFVARVALRFWGTLKEKLEAQP